MDGVNHFRDALQMVYGPLDWLPEPDGGIHRFNVPGDKAGTLNGWYVLYLDGIASGAFGSWKAGSAHTWCSREPLDAREAEQVRQRIEQAKRQRRRLEVAGIHGSGYGGAGFGVYRCTGRPAFADVQRRPWCDNAQRGITTPHLPARLEQLRTIRRDALQVHHYAVTHQRHQQPVTMLAQAICTHAFGGQVRVAGVGAAGVTPQAVGVFGGGLLALVLLGFALAAGLLNSLAHLLSFLSV